MKEIKKPLVTVPGSAPATVKSRGFIHNATDTFGELALILVGAVVLAGFVYSIFENVSFFDGVWWSIVTGFTTGYGDVVPHTIAGRTVGTLLMTFTVFIMIPLITARMASKMIVNDDAWTNHEQERLMNAVERLENFIDVELEENKSLLVAKTSAVKKK